MNISLTIILSVLLSTFVFANEKKEVKEEEPRINKYAKKIVLVYENAKLPYQIDKRNLLTGVEAKGNLIEFTIKNNTRDISYISVKNKVCKRLINFLDLGGEIKYLYKDSNEIYERYEFTNKNCN